MNEERSKAQRVAHGVPVTVLYVGHGDDEVAIADLSKTIKKLPKVIDKGHDGRRHPPRGLRVAVAVVAADPEGHRPDQGALPASSLSSRTRASSAAVLL